MTATRVMLGTTSLSISSHFPAKEWSKMVKPVILPPGRVRLTTKPSLTGSVKNVNTSGIVFVSLCKAANIGALTGSGSRLDIENINLLATLLVHAQYQGYWNQLGMQFHEEMETLLEQHLHNGLVDAPWVRTDDPESDDDNRFFAALQELVAYAIEEGARI